MTYACVFRRHATKTWRGPQIPARTGQGTASARQFRQGASPYYFGRNVMQLAVALLTGTNQHLERPFRVQLIAGHDNPNGGASRSVALQCLAQLPHRGLCRVDRAVAELAHLVVRSYPRK